ncbi:threonine--tRNA ligase, putative [Plasmodium malariae]|uniref:threonine--tRNA ligase n=1 Tax=Plasmodium malariae TaxID=5858 RepID=A0A1D3PBZ1_PLAMA|nr:threonine--tRNA ligase, putative [Plasmodium malariae]SCN12780.1 threonine--tRNA ligase, putative [Plasmodium malariae]
MKKISMILCLIVTNICINIKNLLFISSVKKNSSSLLNTVKKHRSIYFLKNFININKLTNWNTFKRKKKKIIKFSCYSFGNPIHPNNFNVNMMEGLKKAVLVGENPAYIKERLAKYNELKEKKRLDTELQIKNDEHFKKNINIELLDGSIRVGECHVTTPFHIASSISKKLAEDSIVSKITYLEKVDLELCDIEDAEENSNVSGSGNGNDSGNSAENKHCSGGRTPMLWDMNVPLIGNCKIEFLNIEHEEAKKIFWHSSAHILGSSLEKIFGGYLTIGPALSEGFYYDIFLGNYAISNEHYKRIEDEFAKLTKENVEFEKVVCTKEEVLELFKYNPFKLELIKSKIPDNKKTSVYKCGEFIDLCLGPHIRNTGKVKAFKVLKNSSAYWLGKKDNDSLQRVYGISFQKKNELTDYLTFLEDAKKRDHRNVGKKLNFFFFEKDMSPGSGFWFSNGAKIFNKLIDFMRREYRLRKYEEVITPNVFSCDLWKTSGHYQNYKDCMFIFNVENKEWGMKPMNCPGHCIMFKQMNVSYRSLPIRLADFGVLHRNEITGSLSGLTRVRRFQQDDAHIFCSFEQITKEVVNTLHFLFFVYDLFGFKYELFLSTRPKKFIGNISTWDFAEQSLKDALNSVNVEWKLNEGDGAFYGPKIDILVRDSINRTHQCGTIQLDFQLPIRFNLQYKNKDFGVLEDDNEKKEHADLENGSTGGGETKKDYGYDGGNDNDDGNHDRAANLECGNYSGGVQSASDDLLKKGFDRPVIIHRAILGSVERFVAILIEHTAGKLPFWLSPRQAIVLPVSDKFNKYAYYVYETLNNNFFDVDVDASMNTLNKKIREAQLKQFNFILVVGEKELTTNTVTVRDRDDPNNQQVYSVNDIVNKFKEMLEVNSCKFNQIIPFQ